MSHVRRNVSHLLCNIVSRTFDTHYQRNHSCQLIFLQFDLLNFEHDCYKSSQDLITFVYQR